ncbi:hypothetical protein [Streptomyces mirabilis]|uniref:hypothetical protein n=1 Tax=Streptomyces mirabilis TaxID=68239 RepID=UPI000C67AB07
MSTRTNDEIYEKVVAIKTLLTNRQETWVTKAYFDTAIKGLSKPADGKNEEEPGVSEQLAPLTGIADVVTNLLKNAWIPATVAAVTALGIKFFNWEVLGKRLLAKVKLEPKPDQFFGVGNRTPPGGQVPTGTVDVDRLKNMRSAALALTRSLSDLHKEAKAVASQIA